MIRGVDREGAVFSPNMSSHLCEVGWFPVVGPCAPRLFIEYSSRSDPNASVCLRSSSSYQRSEPAATQFSARQYSIISYYVNLKSGSQQ